MLVKYTHSFKTMHSVYICWAEIIEEFTFVMIHAKVTVEDCISRSLGHLQEPTPKNLEVEWDYEPDPPPH